MGVAQGPVDGVGFGHAARLHQAPGFARSGRGAGRPWRPAGPWPILDPDVRFSRQLQYAVCGLFDLAYHAGSGPLQVRGLMPQGVNTPMLIQDGTGRLWVRKDVGASDMPAQGLLGELLGWFLGRQVGVPIPDAAIWRGHQSGIAWMSAYLDSVLAWDPALADCYDLSDLGAILALDVVLLNRDRNAGNLLMARWNMCQVERKLLSMVETDGNVGK